MEQVAGVLLLYAVIIVVMIGVVVLALLSAGVLVELFFRDIIEHRRKVQEAKLWEHGRDE